MCLCVRLQVSSSCTSVYLDGSEVRGSTNAKFTARFGSVEAGGSITVWVPEMPLDIQVDDVELSHIHGWKVDSGSSPAAAVASASPASSAPPGSAGVSADRSSQCRARYQQSSFEVSRR